MVGAPMFLFGGFHPLGRGLIMYVGLFECGAVWHVRGKPLWILAVGGGAHIQIDLKEDRHGVEIAVLRTKRTNIHKALNLKYRRL
jgi:hypothetical protein